MQPLKMLEKGRLLPKIQPAFSTPTILPLEWERSVKLKEQKDTIQSRFKNGLRIIYKVLNMLPKCSAREKVNR